MHNLCLILFGMFDRSLYTKSLFDCGLLIFLCEPIIILQLNQCMHFLLLPMFLFMKEILYKECVVSLFTKYLVLI